MSRFLKETSEFQEYLAAQAKEEAEVHSSREMTYSEMSVVPGLVKPATFRLPITLLAQLDELKKYTPYKSKAEMVMVMLQDQLDAFLKTCGNDVQKGFYDLSEEAFQKQIQAASDSVFKTSKQENQPTEEQKEMSL